MVSPVLDNVTRNKRRVLLKAEGKRRASGAWGEWEALELPNGLPNRNGWNREIRKAIKNHVFAVLVRPLRGGIHLAVSSLSGIRPTWHEMQRVKDEICGIDTIGLEIYPKQAEVVDEADMFHIFVVNSLPWPEFTIWDTK